MSTTLDQQVRLRLAAHDTRYTAGRRAVVSALANAEGPRSAAELGEELGEDVPVSSLYRSLAVMADVGVLTPHFGTKGVTRYELAEWLTGHHHHLVCTECGAVEDVRLAPELEAALEGIVSVVAARDGFASSDHLLEIAGRCARCR